MPFHLLRQAHTLNILSGSMFLLIARAERVSLRL